jgi:uncharacterized protein
MLIDGNIWVGSGSGASLFLLPRMANRHGLIAGATGTGKTISLKVMAEGFSAMGVPVFLGDIKGDLAGMVRMGENTDSIAARLMAAGVNSFKFDTFPTEFWDVYGVQGHPVRTTISEMGPLLLARMLNLNDTQAGVLNILFRVADDENMLLLDIMDVKAMLAYVGENAGRYTLNYGNVSKATIGAIQRAVAVLEDQGGDQFFGEPALNIADWMKLDESGRGVINVLACDKLFLNPLMYSTFLLWMLSELYETLPEMGDLDKPRMVFFFDEAHLLFNDCGHQLMEKIEQVIRLIRSKGVGVYFVTQNPLDIPMTILGQLGNRVQHALRAYTPLDQKAVKAAAQTFRANPAFDTEEAITQLQTGEALVSFLDEKGAPSIVNRAIILPPQSFIGAIDADLRKTFVETSPLNGVYEQREDRDSAYEYLAATLNLGRPSTPAPAAAPAQVAVPPQAAAPVKAAVPSTTFMVFDPATNGYVAKQLETMSPLPEAAVAPAQTQTVKQNVLVLDPATGQYIQKEMNMAFNPATGQYAPVQTEAEARASAKAQQDAEATAARQAKEDAQAARDATAQARREKADTLRDERVERARRNDSILGRVKNTAISTATRTVITQLTRGLLGGLTGKK